MKSILKSAVLAVIVLASAFSASALEITPSSKYVNRKVTSGSFNAVRTNTSIDIIYTEGPQDITIYAPENLVQYVKVTLKGSEINVSYSVNNLTINGKHNTQVKISSPKVAKFTTASSGNVVINSDLSRPGKEVELIALSAGDIKARTIEAATVTLRTNSAGDIKTGNLKADNVNIKTNSAGDITTGEIIARKDVSVITNSAGDIDVPEIYAGGKIAVTTNSAGDIEISEASAENVSVHSNSSGEISIKSVKATNFEGYTNSSGDVSAAGICDNATLSSTSAGIVHAKNLKANNVVATVRSIGNVECQALKSLKANRYSLGKIKYKGKPQQVIITGSHQGGVDKL